VIAGLAIVSWSGVSFCLGAVDVDPAPHIGIFAMCQADQVICEAIKLSREGFELLQPLIHQRFLRRSSEATRLPRRGVVIALVIPRLDVDHLRHGELQHHQRPVSGAATRPPMMVDPHVVAESRIPIAESLHPADDRERAAEELVV
jgi:hypothetical protein